MKVLISIILTLGALLAFPATSSAWDTDGLGIWPDGRLRLRLHLRGSPTYSDGSRPNTVAIAATEIWNRNMERLEFTTEINDNRQGSQGNGVNNVYFDNEVQNQPFDEFTLAVTMIRSEGQVRLETDVVVNSEENWDSYRGPFNYDRPELRRVLLHEFGHVLGLDHPDEAGQFLDAMMNSSVSDLEGLVLDDQEGIAALYGRGVDNPAGQIALDPIYPYDLTANAGDTVTFSVLITSGDTPFTFQWRKNSVAIPGATNPNYQISPVATSHAGTYSVVVTNAAGSVTSRGAMLTVSELPLPTIIQQPGDATVMEGGTTLFHASAIAAGTVTYQWYHDGTPIPGATGNYLYVDNATIADAGGYHFVVTNPGGSTTSAVATLTVTPAPPPPLASVYNQTANVGEYASFTGNFSGPNGGLSYQWYHDGRPLPGATDASLYFYDLQASNTGEYFVVISNTAGATVSETATLTVLPTHASQEPEWMSTARDGDIVYFLFEEPARIERFDLSNNTFPPAWQLPLTPTAFCVSDSMVYVAFGLSISRFASDGSGETHVVNTSETVKALFVKDEALFHFDALDPYSGTTSISSFDLQTMQPVETIQMNGRMHHGYSLSAGGDAIFGRSQSSEIGRLTVNPDHTFGTFAESSNNGQFADGNKTFVLPDTNLVTDDSGIVYDSSSLVFAGSLGQIFQDLAVVPDGRIVLSRGHELVLLDIEGNPAGSVLLDSGNDALFVHGGDVVAFSKPDNEPTPGHLRIPLDQFQSPAPATAVDPTNLSYIPDAVFVDSTGNLIIWSKIHQNVFRWSPASRRYLPSIPVSGWPNHVTYDPDQNYLYFAHADYTVRKLDLGAGTPDTPFVTSPQEIRNLATAGNRLFMVNSIGGSSAFLTYGTDGSLIARRESSHFSEVYSWNETKRRLYHFRNDSTPDDLLFTEIMEDGTIAGTFDSPYHGGIEISRPIVLSPSANQVLIGSGAFYDADTLTQVTQLDNSIDAATWLGAHVFTARDNGNGRTEVQRWNDGSYSLSGSALLDGLPIGIYAIASDRLVVATSEYNQTYFTMLDQNLNARVRMDESNVAPNSRMLGISTRAEINAAEPVVIAGFSVTGTGTKRILVRAIGPSLANHGLTGVLSDPTLAIVPLGGSVIAENDNWSSENEAELMEAFENVFAFPIASGTADAALILDVAPGSYTAVVSGADGGTGIVLVEVYDMDQTAGTARLAGISTRGYVGTGSSILIPGVAIAGPGPAHLLVRVVGPGLIQHSVQGVLSDPQVVVTTLQGAVISGNNDWGLGNSFETASISAQSYAFPIEEGSPDAAFVLTLQPGTYTFQASGVALGTGVALVEVYELK